MSSHREAPEVSKDPVADNTDVYAFVSPDKPDTVTLVANYIPFQNPQGGPNFYEFGDDVLYEIHVSNRGDAKADVTYQFRFWTKVRNDDTFLYNTGPIGSITDSTWNRPQYYSVTRVERGRRPRVLARHLTCPPVNIGPRSTPDYGRFTDQAVHPIGGGRTVFAGQRGDGFHVDLGSIFDLGTLRPFQMAHLIPSATAAGVNGTQGLNVHSIAIQVPISDVTRDGTRPTDVMSSKAVVGVWATASRQKSRIWDSSRGRYVEHGPWGQVSRLGNPLFNEVITPMAQEGPLERPAAVVRLAVRPVRRAARARQAPARALPGGVPQAGRLHEGPGGPARDPADGHPRRRRPRLPELHGHAPGRHAAAQRRRPAVEEPEPDRPGGR